MLTDNGQSVHSEGPFLQSTTNQLGAEMSDFGWQVMSGEKEQWRSKDTPSTLLSSVFQCYALLPFCLIEQRPHSL